MQFNMREVALLFLLFLPLYSCRNHDESKILTTLQDIQSIKNPHQGIERLDSLEEIISEKSKYVRMRYNMVKARLHDRAYDKPESITLAKQLVEYFEKNGTLQDQQMAYFMAGSIYRDFKDAPTSIDYFLKSEVIADKLGSNCDSALLRCTYCDLSYLYSYVSNHSSCLEYSEKEYRISLALKKMVPTTIMHLALAYKNNNYIDKAFEYYNQAFDGQLETDNRNLEIISKLLYNYVEYNKEGKADTCAQMIEELYQKNVEPTSNSLHAMGHYYLMKDNMDSATVCFEKVLAMNEDLSDMYNVSKALFEVYRQHGDMKNATKYAQAFVAVNDSFDLGKQKEKALTINNWYQYARDKKEEARLIEENRAYREIIFKIIISVAIMVIIALSVFYHYRQQKLIKIISLNEKVKDIGEEKKRMERQVQEREHEMQQTQKEKDEIDKALATLNEELCHAEMELKEKKKLNQDIIDLLHQNQLETDAEETFNMIKVAAQEKRMLSAKEWNELYSAVDGQWPAFKEQICEHLHPLTDNRKRVCYLKKAGFTPRQIEDITDISHSTIWRLIGQFKEWMD